MVGTCLKSALPSSEGNRKPFAFMGVGGDAPQELTMGSSPVLSSMRKGCPMEGKEGDTKQVCRNEPREAETERFG